MNHEPLIPIVPLLTKWYSSVQKPLPWRRDSTPYHVWISEIMLQQTRIEAVIPYYERFLRELPDVGSLSAVPDDRLMKLWEGLGYYSRARNLKKAAVILMNEYGGTLPSEAEELRKLPGIGDYTSGAIASIAYGKPEPAVDGNVLRVVSRVLASDRDVMLPATRRDTADALRMVYPTGRDAGLLTEGLMELGETVCIPNGSPKCEICPLSSSCAAYLSGATDRYPVRSPKKERACEDKTVLLLRIDGRYAIAKRLQTGLLAGMWEFPSLAGHKTPEEATEAVCKMGLHPVTVASIGTARHIFTHVEWNMLGYEVECAPMDPLPGNLIWKTAGEIQEKYALPTAFRKWKKTIVCPE